MSSSERTNQQLKVLKILWVAMLMSVGTYAFVGVVLSQKKIDLNPMLPTLMYGFGAVGAILTVVHLNVLFRFRDKMAYFVYTLLRLVMAESIAVFGLILLLMGANQTVFFGFLGWAILLILLSFPAADKAKQFANPS
ncbi:MAG: hypothetical protein EP343_10335 [Deltaproteobacteria bacterium]|nr:MAG: hypothetical protein EP343_10335 [Deltaproteobacteria bacterium]